MRILAICGSLRSGSYNRALVRAAADVAPAGLEVVLCDGLREIPAFDEDLEGTPPAAVEGFKQAIADADAVLFATPEYNGSIPGFLKNAIDWASRPHASNPLRNKPAAVIGASTGAFGAVWAQAELRKVLGMTGARVLDAELPVARAQDAVVAEELLDSEVRERLADILDGLTDSVRQRADLVA